MAVTFLAVLVAPLAAAQRPFPPAFPDFPLPFGVPETLDNNSVSRGLVQLASNSRGDVLVGWQGASPGFCCGPYPAALSVKLMIHSAGGPWKGPFIANETPAASGPADFALRNDGSAVVAWLTLVRSGSSWDGSLLLWVRELAADGTWSSQLEAANVSLYNPSHYSPGYFGPRVIPAGNGTFDVLWGINNGSMTYLRSHFDTVSGWQAPQALPFPAFRGHGVSPLRPSWFGPAGDGVLLQSAIPEPDVDENALDIWAIPYRKASGWQSALRLDSVDPGDAYDPALAADAGGNLTAAWRQFIEPGAWGVFAASFDPLAGWGNATMVALAGRSDVGAPSVARDEIGDTFLVWRESNATGAEIRASRLEPGGGWSAPVTVATPGVGICEPVGDARVVADRKGNATAVWVAEGALYLSRFSLAEGWRAPVLAAAVPSGYEGPLPSIDAAGNVIVVWQEPGSPACFGVQNGPDTLRALVIPVRQGALQVRITSPPDGSEVSISSVTVTGITQPGASVAVNGMNATVADNGSFALQVELAPGLNLIQAYAMKWGWDPAGDSISVNYTAPAPAPAPPSASDLGRAEVFNAGLDLILLLVLAALIVSGLAYLRLRASRKGKETDQDEPNE